MTKKDYIAIAEAINETRDTFNEPGQYPIIDAVARNVAQVLQKDNSRFDRARFLQACGVED